MERTVVANTFSVEDIYLERCSQLQTYNQYWTVHGGYIRGTDIDIMERGVTVVAPTSMMMDY